MSTGATTQPNTSSFDSEVTAMNRSSNNAHFVLKSEIQSPDTPIRSVNVPIFSFFSTFPTRPNDSGNGRL